MVQTQLSLVPDTSAPSKARELFHGVMKDQAGSERFRRALLALSEVVTNAVSHGALDTLDPISLVIDRTEDLVSVQVVQPRPVLPPLSSPADMPQGWATYGFGLRIIDAVADRWGVELDPPSVWFEIRL